ncbi:hypothetical protein KP509_28G069500 [Ceratopteris richardii]|uniref:CASP-like protein n=1 Tax=Ceratopteris richardii TaxID=49495 RepID=A0A8T2RFQ8_CERRI|nr:hypothetical protein KP509_28G069500 [Ceratopteris richardii]
MGGYFHEQIRYEGRPAEGTALDTMNLSEPARDPQFDTSSFGQGPHRPQTSQPINLKPPVQRPQASNHNVQSASDGLVPEEKRSSQGAPAHRDIQKTNQPQSVTSQMTLAMVIAALVLRVCAVIILTIGLALIAPSPRPTVQYAMTVATIGVAYSIFEAVSMTTRLVAGRLMLPKNISSYVSYIGDQALLLILSTCVIIVLLLTGGSAGAALVNELDNYEVSWNTSYCDLAGNFCRQIGGGVAMIFVGFACVAASFTISTFCLYRNKL